MKPNNSKNHSKLRNGGSGNRKDISNRISDRHALYVEMINHQLTNAGLSPIAPSTLRTLLQNHFEQRSSSQKLQSELGHLTGTWEIDWWWIADHVLHDYFEYQQVISCLDMASTASKQIKWYKWVNENSPPKARAMYLSDPNNIDSEPILFTLEELLDNGNCLYPPPSLINPVIGAIDYGYQDLGDGEVHHMYDNTLISHISEHQVWDPSEKKYKVIHRSARAKILAQFSQTTYLDRNGLETDHLEDGGTIKISYKNGLKEALEKHQKKNTKKSFWKRLFG